MSEMLFNLKRKEIHTQTIIWITLKIMMLKEMGLSPRDNLYVIILTRWQWLKVGGEIINFFTEDIVLVNVRKSW